MLYQPSGTALDPAFSATPIDTGLDTGAGGSHDVVVQPNDKVLVLGDALVRDSGYYGYMEAVSVKRYNVNGTTDNTFGTDGQVTIPIIGRDGEGDSPSNLLLEPNGDIVVAGSAWVPTAPNGGPGYGGPGQGYFAAVCLNPDGLPMTSFEGTGTATALPGGWADAAAIQPDGRIVLGGEYNGQPALVRLNADGTVDTTYGAAGVATIDMGSGGYGAVEGLAVQPNGEIVAALSTSGRSFDVALVEANGVLDPSFGGSGLVSTSISSSDGFQLDSCYDVAVEANGEIVVGGMAVNGYRSEFALVAYTAEGDVNSTWGQSGAVFTDVGGGGYVTNRRSRANGEYPRRRLEHWRRRHGAHLPSPPMSAARSPSKSPASASGTAAEAITSGRTKTTGCVTPRLSTGISWSSPDQPARHLRQLARRHVLSNDRNRRAEFHALRRCVCRQRRHHGGHGGRRHHRDRQFDLWRRQPDAERRRHAGVVRRQQFFGRGGHRRRRWCWWATMARPAPLDRARSPTTACSLQSYRQPGRRQRDFRRRVRDMDASGSTLTLDAANSYEGDTGVYSGTLAVGNSQAIPTGPNAGIVALFDESTVDLMGQSITLNGLAGFGTVTSSVPGNVTLTVGADDRSSDFCGTLQDGAGTLALVKIGIGDFSLEGTNTYSGTTTIGAGALCVGNGAAAAPLARARSQTTARSTSSAATASSLTT